MDELLSLLCDPRKPSCLRARRRTLSRVSRARFRWLSVRTQGSSPPASPADPRSFATLSQNTGGPLLQAAARSAGRPTYWLPGVEGDSPILLRLATRRSPLRIWDPIMSGTELLGQHPRS